MAELVDALALGASGATRESSSLSFRTIKLVELSETDLCAHVEEAEVKKWKSL